MITADAAKKLIKGSIRVVELFARAINNDTHTLKIKVTEKVFTGLTYHNHVRSRCIK